MTNPEGTRLVTFRVGADLFAADIAFVERVLRYESPRAIPNVPDWMEGVLDHAGRVIPVVDLRRRFGATVPTESGHSRTMVLRAHGEWVGAVVDQVLDVRPVSDGDIAPPPSIVRGLAGEYVHGVVRRNDTLVVVLDVERVFGALDRLTPDAVGAETPASTSADV